jgi:SAM-dependent methyltransferase
VRFSLDTPAGSDIEAVTRFSGWCLSDDGLPVERVFVQVDGLALAQLERVPRWDLGAAFPQFAEAVLGGFAGDVVFPDGGRSAEVELVAEHRGERRVLLRRRFRTGKQPAAFPVRRRAFELGDILETLPRRTPWEKPDGRPAPAWPALIAGVPHFHDAGSLPTLRMLEEGPTNNYSSGAFEVMDAVPADGVFVDLGCGIRRPHEMRANGLYLDAVHFRGVDVVASSARLPLRDASVDAVVSLGVFEHLPDPWAMAREIERILKPGGTAWIETAFMQPMHADPGHFYNMTAPGLLRAFAAFRVEACGVLSHQMPSYGLQMQFDQAVAHMRDGPWKRRVEQFLADLRADGTGFDDALGPIARRTLAAGVYLRARKAGGA